MCLTAKLADECTGSRRQVPTGRPVALSVRSVTDILVSPGVSDVSGPVLHLGSSHCGPPCGDELTGSVATSRVTGRRPIRVIVFGRCGPGVWGAIVVAPHR